MDLALWSIFSFLCLHIPLALQRTASLHRNCFHSTFTAAFSSPLCFPEPFFAFVYQLLDVSFLFVACTVHGTLQKREKINSLLKEKLKLFIDSTINCVNGASSVFTGCCVTHLMVCYITLFSTYDVGGRNKITQQSNTYSSGKK